MKYAYNLITWGLLFAIWGEVSESKFKTSIAAVLFAMAVIWSVIERKDE